MRRLAAVLLGVLLASPPPAVLAAVSKVAAPSRVQAVHFHGSVPSAVVPFRPLSLGPSLSLSLPQGLTPSPAAPRTSSPLPLRARTPAAAAPSVGGVAPRVRAGERPAGAPARPRARPRPKTGGALAARSPAREGTDRRSAPASRRRLSRLGAALARGIRATVRLNWQERGNAPAPAAGARNEEGRTRGALGPGHSAETQPGSFEPPAPRATEFGSSRSALKPLLLVASSIALVAAGGAVAAGWVPAAAANMLAGAVLQWGTIVSVFGLAGALAGASAKDVKMKGALGLLTVLAVGTTVVSRFLLPQPQDVWTALAMAGNIALPLAGALLGRAAVDAAIWALKRRSHGRPDRDWKRELLQVALIAGVSTILVDAAAVFGIRLPHTTGWLLENIAVADYSLFVSNFGARLLSPLTVGFGDFFFAGALVALSRWLGAKFKRTWTALMVGAGALAASTVILFAALPPSIELNFFPGLIFLSPPLLWINRHLFRFSPKESQHLRIGMAFLSWWLGLVALYPLAVPAWAAALFGLSAVSSLGLSRGRLFMATGSAAAAALILTAPALLAPYGILAVALAGLGLVLMVHDAVKAARSETGGAPSLTGGEKVTVIGGVALAGTLLLQLGWGIAPFMPYGLAAGALAALGALRLAYEAIARKPRADRRVDAGSRTTARLDAFLTDMVPELNDRPKIVLETRDDGSRVARLVKPAPAPAEKPSPQPLWKKLFIWGGLVSLPLMVAWELHMGTLGASLAAGFEGWRFMLKYAYAPYMAVAIGLHLLGRLPVSILRNDMVVKVVRVLLSKQPRTLAWFLGPRMAGVVSTEEVLFRGLLFGGLMYGLLSLGIPGALWIAAIGSGLVFSAFHVPGWGFHWLTFGMRTVLGAMLALIVWQSSSLLAGTVAHFLFNTAALTFALLVMRLLSRRLQRLRELEAAYFGLQGKPLPSFWWTILHHRRHMAELKAFERRLEAQREVASAAASPRT